MALAERVLESGVQKEPVFISSLQDGSAKIPSNHMPESIYQQALIDLVYAQPGIERYVAHLKFTYIAQELYPGKFGVVEELKENHEVNGSNVLPLEII